MSEGINVLSLFDGMSCGQIALQRAGIKVNNYFASEIDKHAIKVTMHNYPNTIQLGDVTKVKVADLPKIDLLIGGSPCQSFSFNGNKEGLDGKSKLFFEYLRLLNETNPKYFLLENVVMKKEWQETISHYLGVDPVKLNSSSVSAQNRPRLYWSNINFSNYILDRNISLKSIIQNNVDESFFLSKNPKWFDCYDLPSINNGYIINRPHGFNRGSISNCKIRCLTTSSSSDNALKIDDRYRKLTPIEFERLQTVPDNYTSAVSNSQRYKMLANGWTVDVIAHILKGINNEIVSQ